MLTKLEKGEGGRNRQWRKKMGVGRKWRERERERESTSNSKTLILTDSALGPFGPI